MSTRYRYAAPRMGNNTLGLYDPLFYAQESLIQLEKALGMAGAVYRGYDKTPQQKGSTINISRPSYFQAADAPSVAQDLSPTQVQISLNQWKEVKIKLTDKELSYTTDKIIQDHIRPATVAIADAIDQSLTSLYTDVPWFHAVGSTAGVPDITAVRKLMFENKVPLKDVDNMHWMIDGDMEADFLGQQAFTQFQGAGDMGVQSQVSGMLGRKFGYNFFANQNVEAHTAGALTSASPTLNGAVAKGATTLVLKDTTLTGALKKGDTFVLAGSTQRYAVTQDATASGNNITVTFTPQAATNYADGTAATIDQQSYNATMAFHRNAFALAMAPLSDLGNQLGARIATISDPITNLSLRSRLFYNGDQSTVYVAIDALWGVTTLDPNLACIARN